MATRFRYSGRDRYGELVNGHLEARDVADAVDYLAKQRIVPLDITEDNQQLDVLAWLNNQTVIEEKIRDEEMANFFQQLALLCRASVPISRGLHRLSAATSNKRLAKTLAIVADEVANGSSLSNAFSHHPEVFSNIAVQLAMVGEDTGNLEASLQYVAHCIEISKRNHDKMMGALRYPMFIVAAAIVAVMVMNIYVIPKFVGMFSRMQLELPFATRIIMASSNFIGAHKIAILAFFGLVIGGWHLLMKDEQAARRIDEVKLKIPYVGALLRDIMVSQFAWSFKMMLESGVTVVKSIRMSSGAVFNRYFSDQLLNMAEEVEHGSSFTDAMRRSGLFPPMAEQILEIGEETQRLGDLSAVLAKASDEEVDRSLSRLAEVVEPILLAVVGGIVLVMVMGIYLPMWDMIKMVNH